MNDEQLGRATGKWLRDLDSPPANPQTEVQQAMKEVRVTGQVRRWWPFPVFRQKARTPTATDTAEYQPSPIPATDGHTPIAIGRTSTMLSPAKAITVGVIAFAIGGAFLIAQPFDQQASVPEAQTPEAEAVEFSVMFPWYAEETEGTSEVRPDRITETVGFTARTTALESSDPRLDGVLSASCNSHTYPSGELGLHSCILRIETEGGAWQNQPAVAVEFPDESGYGQLGPFAAIFEGEGGYVGLTAIAEAELEDEGIRLHGLIVNAGLPADPEPPA